MTALGWMVLYCIAIAAVSLCGGWLPTVMRLTHKRMELMLSFVAGAMLGVAVLHMLPHAVMMRMEQAGTAHVAHGHDLVQPVGLWLLAGFLLMFFVERFFAFHHHEAAELDEGEAMHDEDHVHAACNHDHHSTRATAAVAGDEHLQRAGLTWTGAAAGLTIHSAAEGIALAASIAGESHGGAGGIVGLGTFLVIVFHKPFDAMTLATLMLAGGRSRSLRLAVNFLFSLIVPIGAAVFWLGLASPDAPLGSAWVSAALAFSAGTFLCIALSDLLPELRFHQHDRFKLSAALLAGLAVAWGTAALESRAHIHDHGEPALSDRAIEQELRVPASGTHDDDHDH